MLLNELSKMELVSIGRALNVKMGDYARASKADLIARLLADHAPEAVESTATALIAGIGARAPMPMAAPSVAVPTFVAPTYDHIHPVATERASKVFGIRSLSDIEVEIWNDPGAPEKMADFRWNPKHLRMALVSLKRQRPVWLGGPAGTGKTEFVRQLCAHLGRAFVRVQFDASLESYHIIGGERVRAASTHWQDGLVLQGYRRPGAVILLDEISFARSEYTSSLHAALEPAGVVTVPETGEVVKRATGVTFFAADNSNGRGDSTGVYTGLREQSQAFLNRFGLSLTFKYMEADDEAAVVVSQTGAPVTLARLVVDFLNVCRAQADAGSLEAPPTMREAFYLSELLMDGIAPRDAFEATVVNRAPLDCQEILQQLWSANVSVDLIERALAGEAVVLKTAMPPAPPAA